MVSRMLSEPPKAALLVDYGAGFEPKQPDSRTTAAHDPPQMSSSPRPCPLVWGMAKRQGQVRSVWKPKYVAILGSHEGSI